MNVINTDRLVDELIKLKSSYTKSQIAISKLQDTVMSLIKNNEVSDEDNVGDGKIYVNFDHRYATSRYEGNTPAVEDIDVSSIAHIRGFASAEYMFAGQNRVKSITGIESLDTNGIWFMDFMFIGCESLEDLPLSNLFDTSQVELMMSMFSSCSSLKNLTLPISFNTSKVTDMSMIFSGCSALETLTLPEAFDASSVTEYRDMFYECYSLKTINCSFKMELWLINNREVIALPSPITINDHVY